MPPFYRLIEVAVYSLINFLPFMSLAMYPFKDQLRFSKKITCFLFVFISLIQICLGIWASFFSGNYIGLVSLTSTIVYFSFYYLTIKAHFGQTLFTLMLLSNITNLTVMLSKCIEGQLFPVLALQNYRWTHSLMMVLVEIVLLLPLFHFIIKRYSIEFKKEVVNKVWSWLWLIPVTFYLIWYYHLYVNSNLSSLEIALSVENSIFLLLINLGEALVYLVICQLILEMDRNLYLTQANQHLMMQNLQHENLKQKINEARMAKHDVRQHISIMNGYLQKKEYEKLQNYLMQYQTSIPQTTMVYCENDSINMLLVYMADLCMKNDISFNVHAIIPENIDLLEKDLSVILGNLIENAIDATKKENHREIIVKAKMSVDSFVITIDNSFSGLLKKDKNGDYLTTKPNGSGLGLLSVKNTVQKYNGILSLKQEDNWFKVSILLNL